MLPPPDGWAAARCAPDAVADPGGLDGLEWLPARVPGTAAGVLRDAGLPAEDLDASDWWFRTRFAAEPRPAVLCLDGLATVADVWLNGALVLSSESMFLAQRVDVELAAENALEIRFRALAPLLAVPRRPRARWRTKVADGGLRFFRTSVFGRAPGFAPGPAPVGPWRPVRVVAPGEPEVCVRARLEGDDGVVTVRVARRSSRDDGVDSRSASAWAGPAEVVVGGGSAPLEAGRAEVRVPGAARWWPHTHGEPVLHEVRVVGDGLDWAGRVGFREVAGGDVEADGLALRVNGVPVFARGGVWTPVDPVALNPTDAALRAALVAIRDAGMNMVRVPGIGVYETAAFHALCDELGLLVWQDLMFANFDYPAADPGFAALVEREVGQILDRVGAHPSTVVVCGNSEVEQQAAMLGLDPGLGRTGIWEELVPRAVRAAEVDAVWVPSAPCGGDLPFRADRGVANWFGVGGYRLGLDEARRAGVRFASECLAFANVGDDDARALEGVPRDVGSPWDFADVRDHYLRDVYGVDPGALRAADPGRYLELSRAVTGEVMAEVFGEWRRAASPCHGGLVLWLRDVLPGSGWGLFDAAGRPKAALGPLRRVLSPVAVWTTDERLGGIAVHAANDGPEPVSGRLRVALYRGEHRVDEASEPILLAPRSVVARDVEGVLGHFADAAYAYRFGPPGHDAVVVTLEDDGGAMLGQAFRFPAGRPLEPGDPGLEATLDGTTVRLRSRGLAYGVRVHAGDWLPADDLFAIEPGGERRIELRPPAAGPLRGTSPPTAVDVSALNLAGRLRVVG